MKELCTWISTIEKGPHDANEPFTKMITRKITISNTMMRIKLTSHGGDDKEFGLWIVPWKNSYQESWKIPHLRQMFELVSRTIPGTFQFKKKYTIHDMFMEETKRETSLAQDFLIYLREEHLNPTQIEDVRRFLSRKFPKIRVFNISYYKEYLQHLLNNK